MVIDTSAIIAILLGEPDSKILAQTIASDSKRLMSAFSVLESGIVIEARKGKAGGHEPDILLLRTTIKVISMDVAQTQLAREAWRTYGKGNHPAALNIGDCCSYALAKHSGEPLLFKGNDFSLTDIPSVELAAVQAKTLLLH